MDQPKPSYKSVEGGLTAGTVVTLLPVIAWLAGIDFNQSDADKAMELAKTVEDVAKAYKLSGGSTAEIIGLAKLVAILAFLHVTLKSFIVNRTDLKKFYKKLTE